ncbi:MAG: GtrA family protein [Prevotella sp.]|jgi:putative flippase GtrA|nr:GtrA family protein [Prevotella sp.]MCH4182022.1 GtrA family protein [Prevotella sp.]MCH4211856.1 GtrA family protein [Prevotella sp.]MCH4240984.1 GtrA family protein [Prevotella sp.]
MGHLNQIKHEIWLISKAEMSASVASIIDFGLSIGLTEEKVLPYLWANLIGVISGGITNCCINYRYVFKNTRRNKKSIALRYFMVWSGSLVLNGGGTDLITYLIGENYFIIVKCIISIFVALLWNYPGQRRFVFSYRYTTSKEYHKGPESASNHVISDSDTVRKESQNTQEITDYKTAKRNNDPTNSRNLKQEI